MTEIKSKAPSQIDEKALSGRDVTVDKPMLVAPKTRDLDQLAGEMESWLAPKLTGAKNIKVHDLSYPLGAGMSHETILFEAEWEQAGQTQRQGMVVRIKPTSQQVYLDDMFDQQYAIMDLLHHNKAVPVAEPLWLEPSPDLLGSPFFVMKRAYGRVAVSFPPYSKQGWLFDAAPAERQRAWSHGVRCLAGIQTVPVSDAAFLRGPRTGSLAEGPDQEIDRWQRYLNWVDPKGELTYLRECFDRLLAARPKNEPEGIVWGDARIGNMMVDNNFDVIAVMDWEQPSLGGALHDLGYWLYTDLMQTTFKDLPRMEGMGTREEVIALWEETCGKSAADVDWYMAFAALKMECMNGRMIAAGTISPATRKVPFGTWVGAMLEKIPGA